MRIGHFFSGMRTLWRLTEIEHQRLLLSVWWLFIAESLSLVTPLVFGKILDILSRMAESDVQRKMYAFAAILVISNILLLLVRRFLQEPTFLKALIHLERRWPIEAHQKLLGLSMAYHEQENTGKTISKVTKGVEKLVRITGDVFWSLIPAIFTLVLSAITMFFLDWRLAVIFTMPIIPVLCISAISHARFRPEWEIWENMRDRSVGVFCGSIINVRTVQAFVAESRESLAHGDIRCEMQQRDELACLAQQRYLFAMEMVLRVSFVAVIVAGFLFVSLGWNTPGTIAFFAITGSAMQNSFWQTIQVCTQIARDLVSAEQLQTLLGENMFVADSGRGAIPTSSDGELSLCDVSIVHQGKEMPTLSDIHISIQAGEMIAFVGKSGSGKSTLADLILRMYDPTAGEVTLNGVDIRKIDRAWYRGRFAYVPQNIGIFDGTILENVVYANPSATEHEIDEALKASCLDEQFADKGRFPLGLLTEVGERGVRLSGGECQRIGVARAYIALLSGASTLILDEATSSLDSASERVVQRFMEELRTRRSVTIIVIAHRLSTIQKADKIYVLDEGRIVEKGDHNSLLQKNGLYSRLVELQRIGEIGEG